MALLRSWAASRDTRTDPLLSLFWNYAGSGYAAGKIVLGNIGADIW